MNILVFGAGPLGSILAARLHQGGHHVSLLARGQRLRDLQKYGICLKSSTTEVEESIRVPIVDRFTANDQYDLVIVVMRKNSALKILPLLAENKHISLFLFLMNNAAGPRDLTQAMGADRVMMGFPGMAGYRQGHLIVHLGAEADQPAGIVLGEIDGTVSERARNIAEQLECGRFINASIESNIDAWLKYHVALLFPALATVFYLCGYDHLRFSRNRDAIVLAWRGIKEAFAVLKKLGYPFRPPSYKRFLWIPEPIMVLFLKKMLKDPRMDTAMGKHAEVIRDEIEQLNREFRILIARSGLFTPTIDFL